MKFLVATEIEWQLFLTSAATLFHINHPEKPPCLQFWTVGAVGTSERGVWWRRDGIVDALAAVKIFNADSGSGTWLQAPTGVHPVKKPILLRHDDGIKTSHYWAISLAA